MAIIATKDYVFVPTVDIVMDKACFVGTKTHMYIVLDNVQVDRGFWIEALANDNLMEKMTFDGQAPKKYIAELLTQNNLNLEQLHSFFERFGQKWPDGVKIYDLSKAKTMKVKKGFWIFGGSIVIKFEGDMGFTLITNRIPRPNNVEVSTFYNT
ncbi:MAG: hypothetical protein GY810_06805 [Aureispira sp.]|nr:hypothetical protein [Aureispira sp.]